MRKQAIKSVLTLVAIALVLSAILTILNFVLYVSPEERTMRAITKIYGSEKEYSVILNTDDENKKYKDPYGFGEITTIYKVEGENTTFDYLFKSKGLQGYKGGSITCWVQVKVDGNSKSIEKVIVESYDKQTLMSKVTGSFWSNMYKDVIDYYNKWFYSGHKDFLNANPDFLKNYPNATLNPIGGASMSATAGANAINCVIACMNEYNFGGNA